MVSRTELLHRMPQRVAAGRATLLEHGWLSLTPPAFQQALLDLAIWRTAEDGCEFLHAGDPQGCLAGIAAGTVEFSAIDGHPDTRYVHLAHAGFWAGYRPLLGKPRIISAVARKEVLWLSVPQHAMQKLLDETPQHWRSIALMADMGAEVAIQIMADLTHQHALPRVAGTLLRLAGCRQADPVYATSLDILVSQTDIAALSVMSRNTLREHLTELARRNLIEIGYRAVRILNPSGLRALLEMEE